MIQPGKWLFDLTRYGGVALILGGGLLILTRWQDGHPVGGDGIAMAAVGLFLIIVSARLEQRRNEAGALGIDESTEER